MLWKCRVSVLARDLCHVSLCGVTNMTTQALSHFILWGHSAPGYGESCSSCYLSGVVTHPIVWGFIVSV